MYSVHVTKSFSIMIKNLPSISRSNPGRCSCCVVNIKCSSISILQFQTQIRKIIACNLSEYHMHRGFINIFSKRATVFHKQAKLFEPNFLARKNFPLDGCTKRVKSSSQPGNLLHAWPLMKPPQQHTLERKRQRRRNRSSSRSSSSRMTVR